MKTRVWIASMLLAWSAAAFAGGPQVIGGPTYGTAGQPFTWNPASMPIHYRVDPGPMSISPTGTTVISNASGLQRLQNNFAVWQSVPGAALSFQNDGKLLPAGSYTGGDLATVQQFNDVIASCNAGGQSPVIFDANGAIVAGLGLPSEIIGFMQGCALDKVHGYLQSAAIVLNGVYQDGVATFNDPELSASVFDEAMIHEIGHLIGLDHSQINLNLLTGNVFPCDDDNLAGLPVMFPEAICQARTDNGLPPLAPDDMAWAAKLYPGPGYASTYGTISGIIYFADGASHFQGANVIARAVDDPNTTQDESRRIAVSVISGYRFTDDVGQSVSASGGPDNSLGDPFGSRDSQLIGYYEIPVPPGTYTVEVESIYNSFESDSSIGPLTPPAQLDGPAEFWNQQESAFDFPLQRDSITVHAGDKVTGIDIILNGIHPRFDQYEDQGALFDAPLPAVLPAAAEVRS